MSVLDSNKNQYGVVPPRAPVSEHGYGWGALEVSSATNDTTYAKGDVAL
jgi:hypothetical protein